MTGDMETMRHDAVTEKGVCGSMPLLAAGTARPLAANQESLLRALGGEQSRFDLGPGQADAIVHLELAARIKTHRVGGMVG